MLKIPRLIIEIYTKCHTMIRMEFYLINLEARLPYPFYFPKWNNRYLL